MRQQRKKVGLPARQPAWKEHRDCRLCGQRYMPQRKWQKFCSQRCRQADYDAAHPRVEGERRPIQVVTRQADLFVDPTPATEGYEIGLGARDRTANSADAVVLLTKLVPLARQLAAQAGGHGITVSDVVLVASRRGLVVPDRAHCLGHLMMKAGLNPTEKMRRSPIKKQRGRFQRVWTA